MVDRVAQVVAGAVVWARDMVNTPARELSPDAFAARRSMVYAVFAVSEVTVNDPEVPAMVGDRLTHSPLSIRYW